MKIAWVLGWAVPATWFEPHARRAFPDAEHAYIAPNAGTATHLETLPRTDLLIGYSLGAQILLGAADRLKSRTPVGLLAPIFAFPAERARGGRVAAAQVRYLARWVKRDPAGALQDFYRRAGLDVPAELAPQASSDDLSWGLEQLLNAQALPPMPPSWLAVCGSDDPLLDAARLKALEPRIEVVPGGTHHPATLLPALVQLLPRTVAESSVKC